MKLLTLTPAAALFAFVTACFPLSLLASEWEFAVRLEGWLPDTSGKTAFPGGPGNEDFQIDIEDVLEDLQWGYMGSFDALNGRWGVFTDLIYASISDSTSNHRQASTPPSIPVDSKTSVDLEIDNTIITSAGYYRLLDDAGMSLDLLAGFRYVDIEQTLDWKVHTEINSMPVLDSSGGGQVEVDKLDGIVGLRGRIPLGANSAWMVPYYIDVGTGDSDFTWQAATGIAYHTSSMGIGLVWRILSYDLDSDSAIAELEMTGPAAVFEYGF